jgi:all-trans-retinol 13,14-reductase
MAGVLTATRMLGWRGYQVGKLLKDWTPGSKAEATQQVETS